VKGRSNLGADGKIASLLAVARNDIIFLLCLCQVSPIARAQGLLPPPCTSTATAAGVRQPLLIGDKIPESLSLIDESAKRRTLQSYQSPLEVIVVIFFSSPCAAGESLWPKFRKLNEDYKDWRVAFLAVSTESGQTPMRIPDILRRQGLPWPVLHDDQRSATTLLNIQATPEVLIIDESEVLKYRGPLTGVTEALDTVIGHTDAVKNPEPTMAGGCAL
jgi:peroxiredoxin